jgi:hypothetical protein
MIVDLLAPLMVLAACVGAAVMFTGRRRRHERAELQAAEEHLAEEQELYAAWARIHARSYGPQEPAGVDPRDRMLI